MGKMAALRRLPVVLGAGDAVEPGDEPVLVLVREVDQLMLHRDHGES
jgi:hypothetical protein